MITPLYPDNIYNYYYYPQPAPLTTGELQPYTRVNPKADSASLQNQTQYTEDVVELSTEARKRYLENFTQSNPASSEPVYKKVYVSDVFGDDKTNAVDKYLKYAMPDVLPDGTVVDRSSELPDIIQFPNPNNEESTGPGVTIGINGTQATVILDVDFESKKTKEDEKYINEERVVNERRYASETISAAQTSYQQIISSAVSGGATVVNITIPVTNTFVTEKTINIIQKPASGKGSGTVISSFTIKEQMEQINPIKMMSVIKSGKTEEPDQKDSVLSKEKAESNPLSFHNLLRSISAAKPAQSLYQQPNSGSALNLFA